MGRNGKPRGAMVAGHLVGTGNREIVAVGGDLLALFEIMKFVVAEAGRDC